MNGARGFDIALVLGGGNALGAYQAGAYQALHEHGLEPDQVVGASVGSINGAIICGNPVDRRLAQLAAWWRTGGAGDPPPGPLDHARRTGAALWTLAAGQPGVFTPRNPFGPLWNPFASTEPASLYDTMPLRASLERALDFGLLNGGTAPRFSATAVDVETGDDVIFSTRDRRIDADHLRASSALLPAFPPVEIDGRLFADAGVSANLPIDTVLSETPPRPLLCIAVDLLPLYGARPRTLGETVTRMQDLMFASQSRRTIAAWQAIYDARAAHGGAGPGITLLHIAYSGEGREVSGKAFDFSPETASLRWRAGRADLASALASLSLEDVTAASGLSVYALSGSQRSLSAVRQTLSPTRMPAS